MFKSHLARLALLVTLPVLLSLDAAAATRHWDGGGANSFWDTAANWSNNVALANGDALFFPTNVARLINTNRSSANLTNFDSIRFTGDGYSVFSVPFINLTNGLTNAGFIGSANSLSAGLTLRRNQTWAVGGRSTLTVNSNVNWAGIFLTNDLDGALIANGNWTGTGGAQLLKLGGGRLELNGAASSIPTVRVIDGTLQVDGTLTAATSFVISNGASLTGTGSVSAFTCAGDFSPAGISTPGLLTMTGVGNAVFAPGARFFASLNGLDPGADYDQFKTPTPPNLSGATLIVLRSASFSFGPGQKFVIVTNTGASAITTTFTNLAQNALITNNGVVFQISYFGGSGNDVELTVIEAPFLASGNTRVWDGGGNNGLFSNPANWVGDVAAQEGDSIQFPTSLTAPDNLATNNLTARFDRLISSGSGGGFTLRGQPLFIMGGIIATQTSGVLTIANNVSFDGGGSIQIANTNVTLLGSVDNGGGDISITGGTGRVSFNGVVSGGGGLIVDSSGGVELNNGNLYEGTTRLLRGPVQIGAPGSLGEATSGPTFIGEGVLVNVAATRLFESSIVLTGRLNFTAAAVTNVLTAIEITGSNASMLAGPASSVQFFAPWSGGGAVQLDQGEFILGSTHSVAGGITVANRGRLFANGSGDSDITLGHAVNQVGNLGGTGQVGRVTVASGRGRIAPGNSPGILTTSNLLFTGVTTNTFELNGLAPGTSHDQLRVNGTVALGNARLEIVAGFTPSNGDTFIIIDNDGADAVSGTFSGLAEGALIVAGAGGFRISYVGGTGNDVVLTATDSAFVPSGLTRTWDGGGGGNGNWSGAANWDGNIVPVRGDDLIFPASAPLNTRVSFNNLTATNAVFNRIWFGGAGNSWILRGGALKIFGGVIATNNVPEGDGSFGTDAVELIGPQTWSGTNMGITLNAPLLVGGHTLTVASATASAVRFQDEVLGPGTLALISGDVSFFNDVGASNVTITIQGANVFAGFGPFTGPAWQMSGGALRPGFAQIPGLQMTGGTLDLSGNQAATIAGNLTLAPAAAVFARFETSTNTPLSVAGQVNLAGARLTAGFGELSLYGTALKLIEKISPGAITGTFAGLPEGALFSATNEFNGLVTLYRISYVGGNGNDVTLTPVTPPPSGVTRIWTGAGTDALWPTLANWTGNTPPASGDTVRFPVNAARRVNTNTTPSIVLDAIEWTGSNYVHAGAIPLLSGLRHGAAGGTNTISGALLVAYGANTWAVSNAAAALRVFQEEDEASMEILGPGPVTKTGAGKLELENVLLGVTGGLIIDGGTTRLAQVEFINQAPLFLQRGRIEALSASAESVTATNGELALLFAPVEDEPGFVTGGLSAFGGVTLGSNLTLTLHWTNGAFAGLRTAQLALDSARLHVTFPPALPADETIVIAEYIDGLLTGQFANLPEGAVTNIAGRDWEIHYNVELDGQGSTSRYITLSTPVARPRFTSIERLGNGDVILRGTASPGATVNIEASETLDGFTFIGSTVANGAGQFTFLDNAGGFAQRFYQAVAP